jgi:hypothetical protein
VLILSEKGISGQYLEAAVQALESDSVDAVVKISAVKCIRKSVLLYPFVSLGRPLISQQLLPLYRRRNPWSILAKDLVRPRALLGAGIRKRARAGHGDDSRCHRR